MLNEEMENDRSTSLLITFPKQKRIQTDILYFLVVIGIISVSRQFPWYLRFCVKQRWSRDRLGSFLGQTWNLLNRKIAATQTWNAKFVHI